MGAMGLILCTIQREIEIDRSDKSVPPDHDFPPCGVRNCLGLVLPWQGGNFSSRLLDSCLFPIQALMHR